MAVDSQNNFKVRSFAMDYFDIFDTEDKINEIEKKDCLYTEG